MPCSFTALCYSVASSIVAPCSMAAPGCSVIDSWLWQPTIYFILSMYLSKVPKYRADAQSNFSTLSMGSVPARVPVINSKLEVWEKFQPILYFDGMLVGVK